ncbi:DUF305 domain-containing protein [Kineosporia succinea]|uniref:Uncharacterized protein (DUF305 family) n=1 Tax=Kineosporia succinea TaxID=84632 RepID=A0ABT9NZ52_9ACTN|nr:DUF305 domain-containing protein [Kineosporia succinea]MDP9825699.1 uncharacterized protein (DUF305 family) [Kineosporia succinea]
MALKGIRIVPLAAAAALLLGGCGAIDGLTISTDKGSASISTSEESGHEGHGTHASATTTADDGDSAESGYNAADVMFLQMMLARQAETAKLDALSDGGTLSKEAKALVAAIGSTEVEESEQMTAWLEKWGEKTDADDDADLHKEHGGVTTLTKGDISNLKSAAGSDFQTTFLNLLIAQQSNGAEIAQYVIRNGENSDVIELAERQKESRSAQVQQMLGILSS